MGRILGSWGAKSYILLRCVGLSHQPPSLVFTQPNKYLNRPVIPNANWSSSLRVTICCRLFSSSFFYLSSFCFASTAPGFKSLGVQNVFLETSTLYLDFCYEIVPCKLSWIFSLKIFSGFGWDIPSEPCVGSTLTVTTAHDNQQRNLALLISLLFMMYILGTSFYSNLNEMACRVLVRQNMLDSAHFWHFPSRRPKILKVQQIWHFLSWLVTNQGSLFCISDREKNFPYNLYQ